ncbi:hypothetical protein ABIA14_004850 [Sinorhizobium fredii]
MKVLLDSHAVYWWTIGSDRLSATARVLIEDKANTILVSAVSFYELANKMRLKKLDLKPQELRAAVSDSGLQTLAINDLHADRRRPSNGITAIRGNVYSPHRRGSNIARLFPSTAPSMRYCMNGSGSHANEDIHRFRGGGRTAGRADRFGLPTGRSLCVPGRMACSSADLLLRDEG